MAEPLAFKTPQCVWDKHSDLISQMSGEEMCRKSACFEGQDQQIRVPSFTVLEGRLSADVTDSLVSQSFQNLHFCHMTELWGKNQTPRRVPVTLCSETVTGLEQNWVIFSSAFVCALDSVFTIMLPLLGHSIESFEVPQTH